MVAIVERGPDVNRHVLVVDNEPHIRRLVSISLNRAGYEVATATAMGEALRTIADRPPSLVITDYAMADDGTGLELCTAMRSRPETRETPVVLITGFSHELAGRELVEEFGVYCVFEKPFSPSELVETVHAITAGDWPRVPMPHLPFVRHSLAQPDAANASRTDARS